MATLVYQGPRFGGYFVSEAANMFRSRDTADVTAPDDADLRPGTILAGPVGGALVPYDAAGDDGSEDIVGILYEFVPKGTTAARTYTSRDAEVVGAHLIYPDGLNDAGKATANAALRALGIIVR